MMKVTPLLKFSVLPFLQGTQLLPHKYCKLFPPIQTCSLIVRSVATKNQGLLQCKSNQKSHGITIRYLSNEAPEGPRRKPALFFVQNPFTWIITKLDFIMLKNTWDPEFNEEGFRMGTKQALCTITRLLSESNFDELKGLLSKSAHEDLRHCLETSWSDEQRRNMALEQPDIQVAIPRKVHFKKEGNEKFCDVDMSFFAVKPDAHNINAVIFVEVEARFHRAYSNFSAPDWIVTSFKMPRFKVINTTK